jgi:hydroxymethylpyrimidine kinase/phosphomethylpyrimidine kinase
MEKRVVLTIAGSDSSAGAGIQADLKSFSYLGVHGVTAITCVTAQNTQQVRSIFKVPVPVIIDQIESLVDDFTITAVKTGMLYDEEIVRIVSEQLQKHHFKAVVDPVMVATSGDPLSNNGFLASLIENLLPNSSLITANISEASALAGITITKQEDCEKAAKEIFHFGPEYVLIKGGHLPGEMVTDVLYDGSQFHRFVLPRIAQRKAHGSGCTLSALIAGLIALGELPVTAVRNAKSMVWSMINEGYIPGKGADVLNHSTRLQLPPVEQNNMMFDVWFELKNAVESLLVFLPMEFVPEVGMNVAYGLPNASTRNDICAINGRIIKSRKRPMLAGALGFGVSKHVASIVLASMSVDPTMRSVGNIRYSKETLDVGRRKGFTIGSFDRKIEPASAASTMEWGTKNAIETCGFVPDIIYDAGAVGKEPMIRVLGKKPADVVQKIRTLVDSSLP